MLAEWMGLVATMLAAGDGGTAVYALGATSKGYVVGAPLPPSGLFAFTEGAGWQHRGFNHPNVVAADFDPRRPETLYLAAGNGLIRTGAGGEQWRILTDWRMTEVQDVSLDYGRPGAIYIALPDGIGFSGDGGNTWKHRDDGVRRKFVQSVQVDRARPGRVIAGGENGLWLSEDAGLHWRTAGGNGVMITDVEQSGRDPRRWIATAQAGGLLVSRDSGESWTAAARFGGHTLYGASFDAHDANRMAVCGWSDGVWVSEDFGATWQDRSAGLPSRKVWRVSFDPGRAGRLWASVHEEAVFVSDDLGVTWRRSGLEGSIVREFVFVAGGAEAPRKLKLAPRVRQVIEANAAPDHGGFQTIAARLWLKRDADWCSRRLMELLEAPSGDMFWMFPVTAVAYLDRGQLSAAARAKLREAWRTYMPYRGDTENHWLLYYSTLYLMAQLWPGEAGDRWFTGKSSAANMAEAREYIESWMDLTVTEGQGEYDCTHYIGVYLLPLSYLAAWSNDPAMRERARKMLDWIIADYAVESLDGIYVGAHARTDDTQVLEKWNGVSSDFGWLLFGQGHPLPGFSYYGFFYAASSAYQPPEIIERIAPDRSKPYLHRERKRTRNRWRFTDERHAAVYKTTYMSRDYAVSSDQGGILQPIQQHSWDVTWALKDPRGVANTIFSMHPYSSPFELQMYFPGMPDFITEAVVRSKKSYDSPDKLLGGSPYEQIVQDQDTVIALYDIPPGTRFGHINGFFPAGLAHFEEDASGWIFARGGDAMIAYRPLAPYEWKTHEKGRRLYSPYLKNGTILQAAPASEFQSMEEFRRAILALPLTVKLTPTPSVAFETLRHHRMEFTYGQTPRIDGHALDYAAWKMFEGPFLNSEYGSRRLTLTHGGERREIYFTRASASR